MIGESFGLILALIYLVLVLFGIGFNALVSWGERHKYTEGYLSDFVAAGVAVTIIPFAFIPGKFYAWQVIVMVAGGFVASGVPMMIGSRIRHAKARRDEQQAARLAE